MNPRAAFPIQFNNSPGAYPADPGMTLLEYYAGQALPAIIKACFDDHEAFLEMVGGTDPAAAIAKMAFEIAEEMINHGRKPNEL